MLIVGVGSMAATAVDVAARLGRQGIGVTVVDPRWVKPVDEAIVGLARDHRLVVSHRGQRHRRRLRHRLLQLLNEHRVTTPVRLHGIPQQFLDHAKRASILERIGLTAQTIARRTVEDISELDAATAPHPATDQV